jgi:hypothetical protein
MVTKVGLEEVLNTAKPLVSVALTVPFEMVIVPVESLSTAMYVAKTVPPEMVIAPVE